MTDRIYAALGDSTGVGVGASDGRGYVARLHERLARTEAVRLVNTCVSGATSADLRRSQLRRVPASSFATVFIGINDLIRGTPVDAYRENMNQIAAELAGRDVRTLFCTLPDLAYAPAAQYFMTALHVHRGTFESRTLQFNEVVMETARAHGHGAHDLFNVSLADREHFFSSDGFHPSSLGYEALAQELWPSVKALFGA